METRLSRSRAHCLGHALASIRRGATRAFQGRPPLPGQGLVFLALRQGFISFSCSSPFSFLRLQIRFRRGRAAWMDNSVEGSHVSHLSSSSPHCSSRHTMSTSTYRPSCRNTRLLLPSSTMQHAAASPAEPPTWVKNTYKTYSSYKQILISRRGPWRKCVAQDFSWRA